MSERTPEATPVPRAPSDLEAAAAAWFARLSRQRVSIAQLRAFRAWKADPAHAAAYARIEAAWDKAGRLRVDPGARAATANLLARPPRRRPAARRLPLAGLAATGVITALAWGGFQLAAPAYETRVGEQRLVVLSDGSRVRLNTDTRLVIRYRAEERRLDLVRGEALFDVATNPSRPFVVRAGDARVRALGTRFDIRREAADRLQVTLLEGRLRVAQDRQVVLLAPNQALTVTRGRLGAPVAAEPTAAGWTTGRLTFRGVPLAHAIAEVNRYAARQVRLDPAADPTGDLARRPVSGVFDAGDTEAFVSAVAALFDLQAARDSDGGLRLQRPN